MALGLSSELAIFREDSLRPVEKCSGCRWHNSLPVNALCLCFIIRDSPPCLSLKRTCALGVSGLILAAVLRFNAQGPVLQAQTDTLQATADLHWYRGNMHTHSLWSDGDDYLESIGLWYREHGYQFLVYTDHNTLADKERWIDVLESKGGKLAYEQLKHKFPGDWVTERTTEAGVLEVKLKTFPEVAERLNEPGNYLLIHSVFRQNPYLSWLLDISC